jgi:bile acid:Na+ symporter, BASS family
MNRLSRFVNRRFFWLLIGSYVVAGFLPSPGLWLRSVSLGTVLGTQLTLPTLLLSLLLFNAGVGVRAGLLAGLRRGAPLLGAGVAANLLLPLTFILGISYLMRPWHSSDEVQNILVGLALVASMPVAGSSTAWSQNTDGDMALSLGLVLLTTLLSPLTTPAALHAVGWLVAGDYAEDLHELAAGGADVFLAVCVVLPSFAGLAARRAVGEANAATAQPHLKLVNALTLLALNYSNASLSLPDAVRNPDADFLGVTLAIVLALCVLAFAAGAWLARLLRAGPAQRVALMYGLGMNNNGTGLVLASLALADHPRVVLPIIFYNLVQHLVAGAVGLWLRGPGARGQALAPSRTV